MGKLIFVNQNKEIEVTDGSKLQPTCEEMGIPFACSEGYCGSCVITIVEGMENLSEPTQAEKDFFGEIDNERLACQCTLKGGDVKISF